MRGIKTENKKFYVHITDGPCFTIFWLWWGWVNKDPEACEGKKPDDVCPWMWWSDQQAQIK